MEGPKYKYAGSPQEKAHSRGIKKARPFRIAILPRRKKNKYMCISIPAFEIFHDFLGMRRLDK